mmetsp:Transcript_13922/g.15380  ORF Transcript_13922/g.15380 Transcript_13922/m.15380 type:complete len:369 (-) Transcript_13922:111-1217(-)
MLKAKKFNLADSNLSLFGSDVEKNIKKAAAESEEAFKGAGKAPGLEVWRVAKFQVKREDKADHGQFYSGDSYIVLNTYKKGDALRWDAHFWLGECTTQDEAGTAAYKTVELDDVLGGAPIQHREVMGHESKLFLSYFKDPPIRILEGGIDSGFTHVTAKEYTPRLLWIKGRVNNVVVREVEAKVGSMNSGDVFIYDCGKTLFQWNGKKSGAAEKGKAGQLTRAIDDERGSNVEITVMEEGDGDCAALYEKLGGKAADVLSKDAVPSDKEVAVSLCLYKLSDESGKMEFSEVAKGNAIKREMFDTKDAFIFDCGPEIFAWIGKGASKEERKKAIFYAHEYMVKMSRPLFTPITRILEGAENEVFESFFQ